MNKIYIRASLALVLAAGAASCDENSWNNKLDGFKEFEDQPFANQQSIDYTLTDADYTYIAGNSANKALATEQDNEAALALVGTQKRFSPACPASEYVPAFLSSTDFEYFTLTDGSSVKLTYNVTVNEPEALLEAASVQKYTIDEAFYRDEVWGGEDYVNAFTPLMPADNYVPVALGDFVNPYKGTYCIVSYNQADTEPSFGNDEPAPSGPVSVFAESFTEGLGGFTTDDAVIPEELTFVWSWGGANYGAKASAFKDNVSYATESWLVSPDINLSGYTDITLAFEHVVNKFPDLEFAKANCTLWVSVAGDAWKQVEIPVYTDNTSWAFTNSGDIKLDEFAGKTIRLGFKYVSEEGKSGTWEVKNLTINAVAGAKAPARIKANLPATAVNAVYHFDGSDWVKAASDFTVLQDADYKTMGQSYNNLTAAEPYLSRWLDLNYPYGVAEAVKYVFWIQYAGGTSSYVCSPYTCGEDGKWTPTEFVETETAQFVRTGGKWIYNPNVTIDLPAGKSQPLSSLYYQTIVDWVFETICRPLGDTNIKSGLFYVTSYGNNEYYSGASAYQGNVDLRPGSARAQYPAGYESMTDDEIVEAEKTRFIYESLPAALGILNPDAKPIDGLQVLYTINFAAYNGASTDYYVAVYEVSGPAQFTPISCTWWENGTGK